MGNFWQKITAPFKKAGSAVKKTIGDFFAPAPDQVRVRDFARELPGAAETVGKKVWEFGKDILRTGPRAAASTTLSLTGRKEAVPETTMEKFLWGDKPIKDVRTTGEETVQSFGGSKQTAKKYGLPVGIAFAALDMIPVLPEEKAGSEVLEQLAKKYGDDVAKQIIEKGGKSLAEKALGDGGEKLVQKAGVAVNKIRQYLYELPPELVPASEKATVKHGKLLWNTMRKQFGQTNAFGSDVTKNRGIVSWIIDTLEGGKKELAPLLEKYKGQKITNPQYKKLYALFKSRSYNLDGYKRAMATLKGIEPTIIERTVEPLAKAAEKVVEVVKPEAVKEAVESGIKATEQAVKQGGEQLTEKVATATAKPEPIVEATNKTVQKIIPDISREASKMKITGLEQAAEQLDKTGSAIIAEDEAKNLRLVVKDEGDFIKVGMDAGTGKLLPTDVSLPEKTFKTKEEAFDFIKSLSKPNNETKTLFHGTSAPGFSQFNTDLAYLAKDADEAKAFAENPILGGGRGTGIARVLEVKAPKGKIKDIDDVVQTAIENGDNLDEVIAKEATDAKQAGYDYLSFNHPSSIGDQDFEAIVSINPSKLSISKVNELPPNLTSKAEETLDVINEKGQPIIKAGKKTAPDALRSDQLKSAPPGSPPVNDEVALADAAGSPPGSALDAIDKMVGKTGTAQSIKDWFKGLPQKFTQAFSDRFAGLKQFEDNLSKMAGKVIDIESSPYIAARMYAGRTGIIETGLEDLQKILNPVRSERPDFTRFILARRALERAERGFSNPANVTGADAMKALEELKNKIGEKTYQLFEKAETNMQEWADKTILKPAAEAGIISKDTYNSVLSKNKHWVPFQVLDYLPDAKQADMMKTGSEIFSVTKQGIIKGLESTEKTIRDPFEAIIDKVSSAISLIKRNEVAGKLVKLRDELPAATELIKPLEKTAKVPKGWGSISLFVDGKNTKWAVPEELSWAMHQMNNADAGILGNFLKFTSSAFRKGATNLYIPFSLSNAVRDAQMAVMTSKYGFNAADWVKGFYEGLKGAFGWDSKLLQEFNKSGGGFGGFLQSARDIGGIKNKLFEPAWWRKTKAVINPFNLIGNFAEAIELAPRLGVYNKALKKGASALEAAFEARNSTIDFAKAGQEMRIINMWVPFVNARWQALLNTARVFKDRPIRSAAKASALIVIPGVTTYLWNTINYPDLYDDVPQWIKDTYFPMIVGEDKDKNGNRIPKMVMIPKGDVGQIFYNPLEYTMEYIRHGEPQNFTRLALEWMSQIAPIPFTREGKVSTTQILSSALPPVIKTPMELATNQSFFTDSPIVPGSLEKVSPTEQYNEKTPGLAVTVGRALGLSPMKLAYGVGGLLGGFGREIIDPSKILESSTTRFYRSAGGAKANEAWNLRDEAVVGYNTAREQARRAIQANDVNGALKIIDHWNATAEKMLPDILPYIAQDDPEEADKIRGSVTFSPQDISRLEKSVYNKEMGKSERLGTQPQLNASSESSALKQMRESLKR